MEAIRSILVNADGFQRNQHHAIVPNSQVNVRLALSELGVTLCHDVFADRLLVSQGGAELRLLDDATLERLWLDIDLQFQFRPTKDFFFTVLRDLARRAPFHPVRDYFHGLKWDGVSRLDTWLCKYGGAEEIEYVRAVGALTLIAAVRRINSPGTKFDEMLVLESPQGTGQKSSAIAALCPRLAWFSDDLPLNAEGREIIERTAGHFLIEAAELSGMGKRDVEHLKAFLSRQKDVARLAYDRCATERYRHFIVIGTTNSAAYLRDTTGARRFWPVRVNKFDLQALARDRDQLWAEACAREAKGESIRLNPDLWAAAGAEQEERRVTDPWEEELEGLLGDRTGKILTSKVFALLGVNTPQRTPDMNTRIGAVMKKLGFDRVKLRHNRRGAYHYVRGVDAERDVELEPKM